jgi:hypothetical protein
MGASAVIASYDVSLVKIGIIHQSKLFDTFYSLIVYLHLPERHADIEGGG